MKRPTYHEDLIERLKDPKRAIGYLNACLSQEDFDEGVLLLALRDVAEAHGGLRNLAKRAGLNREHLFKILSKNGNPRLDSLNQLTNALGFRLAFQIAA
jgi:probable addiction module antidote protein